MTRRVLPVSLVVAAALADGSGWHRLAFYALLAAIPALAVTAVDAFGDYVQGSSPVYVSFLGGGLALVVLGEALRGPALVDGAPPAAAAAALLGALALLSLHGVVELARDALERERPRRVARQLD
jgi:hypothetical protein